MYSKLQYEDVLLRKYMHVGGTFIALFFRKFCHLGKFIYLCTPYQPLIRGVGSDLDSGCATAAASLRGVKLFSKGLASKVALW